MFRIHFDQLTLHIEGHDYTYPMEGSADVTDFDDSWKPNVVSIYLMPDYAKGRAVQLAETHPMWWTLAEAITQSCAEAMQEGFNASLPPERQSYADEHRLRLHEVL